jgi:hypothetical protein
MIRTPVDVVQGFIDRQLEAGNSAKHQLLCNVRDKIKEECVTNEIERLQDKLLRAVSVLKELRDNGLSDRYVDDEARNKRVRAVIAENEGNNHDQ